MPKGNPSGYSRTYGTNAKGKALTREAAAKKAANRLAKAEKRGRREPVPMPFHPEPRGKAKRFK